MLPGSNSAVINRRALLAFTGVLVMLVMSVALAIIVAQRQQLQHAEQAELITEMQLLGELATDALLRSDYSSVEGLLNRWIDLHDHVTAIQAVMPNGFVLAERHKPRVQSSPLSVSKKIVFGNRELVTLRVDSDISNRERDFATIVIQVVLVALVLILLLGWALWGTLKRTALQPLEMQIRRREENERELLLRSAALEAAIKELESFSYSVSHDLRGPLRAIDGFSRILMDDYNAQLDAEARRHLARIRNAVQRMGTLIDDLLGLSRVGRAEMQQVEVDLGRLANEVVEELRASDPQRIVQVTIASVLIGFGDEHLLRLALHNLIGNAWKYTRRTATARIEFGALQQDGQTVYFIRDNGAGFDMQYAGKLFGAFQRLHRDDDFEGSGIGLATVQRIIQRHGGRIWAEAEVNEGATFYFTLPSV